MRIEGAVVGNNYVISHDGVLRTIPLAEARADTRLLKAIERNKWERIPAEN